MVTKNRKWWTFKILRLSTTHNGYKTSTFQIPYHHPLSQWLLEATNGNDLYAPSVHLPCTFSTPSAYLPCTSHAPPAYPLCTFHTPSMHLEWISLAKGPHHSQSDYWYLNLINIKSWFFCPITFHAPSTHLLCTLCASPAHLPCTFHVPRMNLIG